MGDSSTEMTVSRVNEENFVFAFNDVDFSDRILRLVILPEEEDNEDDDVNSTDSGKKFKRAKYNDWFSCIQSKNSDCFDGAKVTTLHISSPILAAKSPFFYKLFKNGMRESQDKNDVSFTINASEEATLMELLRFMYGNSTLSATSFSDLVDLLIAADKFEVTSCMRHCVEMLLKFPMSLESALFYLELPSSVLVSEIIKPLIDAAKQHVVSLYKDFTKSQEKAMELPVSAVEVVLGSKGLRVKSEDDLFDFILKWARSSYPELEERREILTKRLAPLICFPNMSRQKLKEVLGCPDFDHEHVSKLVVEALFSKVDLSCGQLLYDLNSKDLSTTDCGSAGRVYSPHCVVFFNITKHECAGLFPSHALSSPQFRLGGKFYLSASCGGEKYRFGLFVYKAATGPGTITLDYKFAVMKKSSRQFESRCSVNNRTFGDYGWGMPDLLGITWTELMSDNSDYFIDGILRLRAELTLKNS